MYVCIKYLIYTYFFYYRQANEINLDSFDFYNIHPFYSSLRQKLHRLRKKQQQKRKRGDEEEEGREVVLSHANSQDLPVEELVNNYNVIGEENSERIANCQSICTTATQLLNSPSQLVVVDTNTNCPNEINYACADMNDVVSENKNTTYTRTTKSLQGSPSVQNIPATDNNLYSRVIDTQDEPSLYGSQRTIIKTNLHNARVTLQRVGIKVIDAFKNKYEIPQQELKEIFEEVELTIQQEIFNLCKNDCEYSQDI